MIYNTHFYVDSIVPPKTIQFYYLVLICNLHNIVDIRLSSTGYFSQYLQLIFLPLKSNTNLNNLNDTQKIYCHVKILLLIFFPFLFFFYIKMKYNALLYIKGSMPLIIRSVT